MICAHTRTLAFMPLSVHTSRSALFLLTIGLDNVQLGMLAEDVIDKIAEPILGDFPAFIAIKPFGLTPPRTHRLQKRAGCTSFFKFITGLG